jgi:pyruvate,water dikinase
MDDSFMRSVLTIDKIKEKDISKIGGKAKNLHILTKNKISVPPWFVVPTDFYVNFIEKNNIKVKIEKIVKSINFSDNKSILEGSKKIKNLFFKNEIPKKDLEILISYFNNFKKNSEYVAIRSSAIGEDDFKASFAGQMDSFLFIIKQETYIESIKKCWASIFSERALAYRHISKLPLSDIRIAVIVQKMIFGEISGVLFTVNPANNNLDEMLINSTFGLGEGIVSGELDTDNFYIDKNKNSIKQKLVEKKYKISFNKNKKEGTIRTVVEKKKQNIPSLKKNQIKKLATICRQIEKIYNIPQDIEWTIKSNKIYILQTRPITTINQDKTKEKILWDNSNIIESFPGITKPLTFSFAKTAWSSVFRQSAKTMGVPEKVVQKNDELFDNMLGLVNGRVYYNLMKWYQFVSFFPGFKQNRKYMEQMMGVKESYKFNEQKNRFFTKEKISAIPGYMKLIYGLVKNYFIIDKEVDRFHRNFEKNYNELIKYDFKNMEPKEVMDIFNQAKNRLLKGWKVEGINDYSAMLFYGVVRSLTKKYKLDERGSIHNDLFCGEENMDSTKPTKHLLLLADKIKKDKKLNDLFNKNNEKQILEKLKKSEYSNFNKQFIDYLDEFGFRCMSELKLEEKSLKDDPTFLITILKNYLNLETLNLDSINQKEIKKRTRAEDLIDEKLKWRPLRKILFYWALRNARKSVRYRENMRLCRTKVFGLVREAFRSIENNFARNGLIISPDDIFYLEVDEIFDFIQEKNKIDFKNIVKYRKKLYSKFEKIELPERFMTQGTVNKYEITDVITKDEMTVQKKDTLTGVSCCPGIVKNKVRVILSPSDNVKLNGEILVADKTDPGWVPLYPSVSGLLIERGSVLSHSAIVARELGLPTIVGIKGLTKKIKDGQVVKMDAGNGVVYLKPDKKS